MELDSFVTDRIRQIGQEIVSDACGDSAQPLWELLSGEVLEDIKTSYTSKSVLSRPNIANSIGRVLSKRSLQFHEGST